MCSRPEMEELSNLIGDFIRYWGFKQIHGRIWSLIYLSSTPLDASDLMQSLGVSKALMSLSLKDLLNYDVIRESHKTERGTQTYEANPNVLDVITNVLRTREKKMLAQISTAHKLLASLPEGDQKNLNIDYAKLKSLGSMIHEAEATLDGMLGLASIDLNTWSNFTGSSSGDAS
ncbi:MAG: hypothetical protein HRT45_17140 [Bdellovibrionales bacterium]|nr:hypothetical protein [Bdellovibrionales bacterium]